MPKTAFRYAVTFEYQQDAPETVRGEIAVSNPSLGVRRAFEAAKKAYPRRHWSSLVVLLASLVVLLERPGVVAQGVAA